MAGLSPEELVERIIAGIAGLTDGQQALLTPLLYTPDPRLAPLIGKADALIKKKRKGRLTPDAEQRLGYMLERIGLMIFQQLTGATTLKSYTTPGPQFDLLINGDDTPWLAVCKTVLNVDICVGILIEAKATKAKVDDSEFQRLGNILSNQLERTAGLGVFVCIEGATGFPERGASQKRSVQAARLTQLVIYHARKKPVVVLDWEDIKQLTAAGSLITTLRRKVREIEEMVELPTVPPMQPVEVALPDHLAQFCRLATVRRLRKPSATRRRGQ